MKKVYTSVLVMILLPVFSVYPQRAKQQIKLEPAEVAALLNELIPQEMKRQHLPDVVFTMVKDGSLIRFDLTNFAFFEKDIIA